MNNLIPLNLILLRFMHHFSSYEHFRRLGHIKFFKGDILGYVFKFKPISVKHRLARITVKPYGTSDYRTLNCPILRILKSDTPFVLHISWLPNIVQKCFCTPDEAMDPTFQMKYVIAFMFVAEDIKQKLRRIFLWTPCIGENLWVFITKQ